MANYKKLYHKAFNAISEAERLVEAAAAMLRLAQQECEELYVETDDTPSEDDE